MYRVPAKKKKKKEREREREREREKLFDTKINRSDFVLNQNNFLDKTVPYGNILCTKKYAWTFCF